MKSWLQLFRAPNLFTVPGDPIAGFLLAYGASEKGAALLDLRVAFAIVASLCLYCAGLAMNDIVDLAEDKRDRPKRPLASGAITIQTAWIATAVLSLTGLLAMNLVAGSAGLLSAVATLGCVALYNGVTKGIPVIGAINMGLCRGLSLLLGAVAFSKQFWPQPGIVVLGALVATAYIAAVTNLARYETGTKVPGFARVQPALVLLGAFILFNLGHGPLLERPATALLGVCLIFAAAEVGRLFRKQAPPLPPVIGALIRVLLPIQAALCVVFPKEQTFALTAQTQFIAIALLVLMPVSRAVGRRFYAS